MNGGENMELKAQVFETRAAAEKAAASVNHYLQEQEMYLQVTVTPVEGGYTVAVVSCY